MCPIVCGAPKSFDGAPLLPLESEDTFPMLGPVSFSEHRNRRTLAADSTPTVSGGLRHRFTKSEKLALDRRGPERDTSSRSLRFSELRKMRGDCATRRTALQEEELPRVVGLCAEVCSRAAIYAGGKNAIGGSGRGEGSSRLPLTNCHGCQIVTGDRMAWDP